MLNKQSQEPIFQTEHGDVRLYLSDSKDKDKYPYLLNMDTYCDDCSVDAAALSVGELRDLYNFIGRVLLGEDNT